MEAKERITWFATAMIVALVLCSTANADHGERVDTSLNDGGLVTSTSWKSNYLIYRSIGGKTEVKGKEMKRKWWCAWLCKRRVNKNAERIEILNTYFAEVQPGVFAKLERPVKVCTNTDICEQKEWAAGVAVKLTFPNGSTTPGQLESLLPVDGLITRHAITVDGRMIEVFTSAGRHPPGVIL
jgi:hypothetical protein